MGDTNMSMFVIDVKCDFPIFSSMTHFVYVPPLPTRETFDDDVINRYYVINQLIYGHKYVT